MFPDHRFVWSIPCEERVCEQLQRIFASINSQVRVKWKFNEPLDEVWDELIKKTQDSCIKWAEYTLPGTSVSFDGGLLHRRQVNHCFASFLHWQQSKFIYFEIAAKSFSLMRLFLGTLLGRARS
jgi:hypothetical protein